MHFPHFALYFWARRSELSLLAGRIDLINWSAYLSFISFSFLVSFSPLRCRELFSWVSWITFSYHSISEIPCITSADCEPTGTPSTNSPYGVTLLVWKLSGNKVGVWDLYILFYILCRYLLARRESGLSKVLLYNFLLSWSSSGI